MPVQSDFQQRAQNIERLLGEIESNADPALRAQVRELLQSVMDLHGAGIERMLELIRAAPDAGEAVMHKLGKDELAASVLVLYGLHPLDLETRVSQALEKVRSRLKAYDGEVELLSLQDGVARLRLHAQGHGCGSTPQSLREMVESAVYQFAPDVTALVIEGADAKQDFVPLEMLQGAV